MDKDNLEFRKLLELAVRDSGNISDEKTLKDLFKNKLFELNISHNQALKLLSMESKTLKPILENSAKRIDIVNIIKLGHFLGLSVNEIMKMYIPDMDIEQISEIQRAREASYMMENFDISSLVKAQFIQSKRIEDLKTRISTFFNFKSIYHYTETEIFPAFSRTKRNSSEKVRNFWLTSAYTLFKGLNNPNQYNRKELINLIPRIRPYTRDMEKGLMIVSKALYNIGITVIFQPSIANLQVRGATFIVNNKPCIVLSDLNKRYPTIWFVLLHELHHILYDLEIISATNYHLTGEPDLFLLNEEAADNFARDYLLSEEKLRFIAPLVSADKTVAKYAESWNIHPSIIYSFYCKEFDAWSHPVGRKIPSPDLALKYLNTNPFEKETLQESIDELKELIYNT